MDSKCNDFAIELLSKKYYGPNDKSPEDVFMRVARIVAIPDLIWDRVHKQRSGEEFEYLVISHKIYDLFSNEKELEIIRLFCARENIVCSNKYIYEDDFDKNEWLKIYNGYVKEYYDAMCNLDFMPASPTLMNAGLGGMLSSCFYLNIEDNLNDIFEKIKNTATIYSSGGGCGIGLSKLRPEGALIKGSGGQSSGPLSFLEVFSSTGQVVVQGGRRKAAALGSLRIDHPDIIKFIKAKEEEGKLSNFNLSVLITDEFMKMLKERPNDVFIAKFDNNEYTIKKDDGDWLPCCAYAGLEPEKYTNKEMWGLICKKAWENGEPGIIFHDVLNKDNLFKEEFGDMGCNPCISGDMLILVADDRGFVSIKQLAEEGKDVPVYCFTDNLNETIGNTSIRQMRNIRCTGKNKKIFCITIGNIKLKLTENHKLLKIKQHPNISSYICEYVEVKDLKIGDLIRSINLESYKKFEKSRGGTEHAIATISYGSIVSIEDCGYEDVYNGTVDEFHNYFVTDKLVDKNTSCQLVINSRNCGELELFSGESCNLLELNLKNCVVDNSIDYNKLDNLVRLSIRFLDNIVSLNKYPLPFIEERTLALRKIGLGTMGLHDVMLSLSIDYGTDKSLELIDQIYGFIKRVSEEKSLALAEQRGIPKLLQEKNINRRNIALTTCPPCGSTSALCNQASSGIEPVFQWSYKRKDSLGEHEINHWIVDEQGNIPSYARTALEITPEEHVKVQAQIQKYIDSSISKTVNLPNSATIEDVDKVYKMAYDLGCKSITVYRNGSRKLQVLNSKEDKKEVVEAKILPKEPEKEHKCICKKEVRERPKVLFGATYRINTPAGKILVTINEDEEGIREIIVTVNKAGTEIASHVATEGRLISTALKYRVPIDKIIEQLNNQKSSPIWDYISNQSIKSVPDAIAKILEDYLENYEGFSEYIDKSLKTKANVIENHDPEKEEISGEICPECGEMLVREGGCISCKSCGYSACGG